LPTKAPDFRDPQGGVDGQPIQGTGAEINLHHQVGRWIASQIDGVLVANEGLVLNPVTLIGLQAAPPFPPQESHRTEAGHVPAQLLDQDKDQVTEQGLEMLVFGREGPDFKGSAIVGDPQSPVREGPEQPEICPPGNAAQEQTLTGDGCQLGHSFSPRKGVGSCCQLPHCRLWVSQGQIDAALREKEGEPPAYGSAAAFKRALEEAAMES